MNVKKMPNLEIMLSLLFLIAFAPWCIYSQERLLVGMTLVRNAAAHGAGKFLNSHLVVLFVFCFVVNFLVCEFWQFVWMEVCPRIICTEDSAQEQTTGFYSLR